MAYSALILTAWLHKEGQLHSHEGGGWVEGIQTIILPLTAEFGVVNKKGPM